MTAPCPIGTDLEHAAALLRQGRLVAFATETVYGLGGDALDPAAVARIFEAKQRPFFDPLIVHLSHADQLPQIVAHISPEARRLAERFWPGPLTIVMPRQPIVPDLVTAGLPTVAVRIPAHPLARELIERAGRPIAAPSANLFGRISPTTAAHVAEQLGDRIDYILDGGPCSIGLESTVLQLPTTPHERPTLLRPGGLPVEELEALIGPIELPSGSIAEATAAPAPGMLTKHYAPTTRLTIVANLNQLPDRPSDIRCGILAFSPDSAATALALRNWNQVEILSPSGDLREAAVGFFAALRRLDAAKLDEIFAAPFPDYGLGRALNDRLRRAAA